jgi:hypothetical protein
MTAVIWVLMFSIDPNYVPPEPTGFYLTEAACDRHVGQVMSGISDDQRRTLSLKCIKVERAPDDK